MNNLPSAIFIGAKISGGRLDKYYAIVEEIAEDYIGIRYNGENRVVQIPRSHISRCI